MENSISPPNSSFARLWETLVRPAPSLTPDERRRVRLYSGILLITVIGAALGTAFIWAVTPPTAGATIAPYLIVYGAIAILFAAYLLTRTRYFSVGVWLSIFVALVDIPLIVVASYRLNTPITDSGLLSFIAIPVMLASLIFTPRRTLVTGAIAIALALSIPVLVPTYTIAFSINAVVFIALTSTLLALATYLRQQYTRQINQQVVQLQSAERALQEANQQLEQRVAQRTAELQQSESKYRAIVENNPDIITVADTNKNITFANVPEDVRAHLVGRSLYDILTPDQQPLVEQAFEWVKTSRETISYELFGANPWGQMGWYTNRIVPLFEGDTFSGITVISTDTTQRKNLEEERERLLVQTGTLYSVSRRLANATSEQAVVDALSDIPFVQRAATVMLAVYAQDAQGQDVLEVRASAAPLGGAPVAVGQQYPNDPQLMAAWANGANDALVMQDVATQDGVTDQLRENTLASGVKSQILVPLRQGNVVFGMIIIAWIELQEFTAEETATYNALPALLSPVVSTIRLIRDLERTINDLKTAKRIADENSRLKSEFLATMSHELRTPMHAIEGFTSIMLNNMGVEIAPAPRRMVERIGSNSKRLLGLINDFLDLSRIEAGRMDIQSAPIDIAQLVESWRSNVQVLADQKGLGFITEIDPAFPTTMIGDEEALSKVALNLLSNAFKFTHQGNVTLSLKAQDDIWTLSVSDTGIGIPPHARGYIFDEFRQVDGSSKREYGGTGLGLAIVQKLVRAMGGTITVTGDVGKGSTFMVTLPLLQPEYQPVPALEV